MDKIIIKTLIVEYQEYLTRLEFKRRDISFEPNANYVIVGPRRCGKTYTMYAHIKSLAKGNSGFKNVLYINFEDERLTGLGVLDLDTIIQAYNELYKNKPIVFLDEIQIVEGWEKFARRLVDTGYRVFVTGSNAVMLSKEIASTLGGRFIIKELYPLSFKEYLVFKEIELSKNYGYSKTKLTEIKLAFNDYLNFGGFPEILLYSNKKEYLSNLYQKVLYSDIVARYSIKNDLALKLLVKKLAEDVNHETSYNRLKNVITSTGIKVGTATIIDFCAYLGNSYLVHYISNYINKFSERESKHKYYFADNGLLGLFLINEPQKLLENIVYNQLKRLYNNEIYYYLSNIEVDFYLPEQQLLAQVCLSISSYDTRKRETSALIKAMKYFKISHSMILTLDEEETIEDNGLTIKVIPVRKWLL
jgi:hypothetical protein